MIKISPAILTNNKDNFTQQLESYSKAWIDQVDIDINIPGDDFYGDITLTVDQVIELIKSASTLPPHIGIHLMTEYPIMEVDRFVDSFEDLSLFIFYLHQEADFTNILINSKYSELKIGITVKAETLLVDTAFYNSFPEVQLMTIETGKQGNSFKPEILNRVEWLRDKGYRGRISVDGGVNQETAKLIKASNVDRVSVGSYFSNNVENFERNLKELENVLAD